MGFFGNDDKKEKLPCGCDYYSCCAKCCDNYDNNKKLEEVDACKTCRSGSNRTS